MGYCVSISIDIRIPKEKVADALAAINALHQPEALRHASGGRFGGGVPEERWYSWVRNPGPDGFPTLAEAIREWRYEGHTDINNDFVVDEFDGEKWGDDEVLYRTLAPFIADGGQILVYGEDDEDWGYYFEHGRIRPMHRDWTTEPEIRDVITVKE